MRHPMQIGFALALAGGLAACVANTARQMAPAGAQPHVVAASDSARGRYVALVGGCNDCHTPGWAESNGQTPVSDWLTGSPVGYMGPWGTTYAANLRLVADHVSEEQWVHILTTADNGHGDPPMPWMNTRQMDDGDLRAVYRLLRTLGPKGERTPRSLQPGVTPSTPYIVMVPRQPGS